MTEPDVWHHGLVARYWAEFETDGGPEAAYFQRIIERSGQPALDLGCGTGRLLLYYLRAGLDVDGCDYSEDMIALCRERAERAGCAPQLYVQAMHELDLPRRYRTIVACGVIGLGGERQLTRQALRRCYEHLRPGGTFAFDVAPRYNDRPAWLSRLPKNRQALPDEWPSSGERSVLVDGSELELVARTVSVDPLAEVQTRQLRARLWRDGELVQEEIHTMRYEEYGMNELLLLLELAGFHDVQRFGDYTDAPATADHRNVVFVCVK
ncbi:MAG: class I SAM-dependent DNA methyltransferase [Anaerolineae bacterium]